MTICLGVFAGEAHAQLYKWVDEKGRTQYSDKPVAGQKSQEIKIQAPPPSSPVPASKSAGSLTPSSKANDKKGVRAGAETAAPSDVKRLSGEWTSAPGSRVLVSFGVSDRGSSGDAYLGQVWTIGTASQIDTASVYSINGSGGNGTMIARDAPGSHAKDVPARIGYRIDGERLILSVSSGLYAGEHILTRK